MNYTYEDPASGGFKKFGKPRYRAGSFPVGTCEARVKLDLKPSVLACLHLVARIHDRQTRKAAKAAKSGRRKGDLGHVALEAYDWLKSEMKAGVGFVAHGFTYIADTLGLSRSAVVEGIHRLVEHGWLRMVRRKDGDGQAVNAYGFSLPRSAYALASRLFGKVDVPEDVARDYDAMCQRFLKWRVEWEQFLRHMKDVWKAEGKPVAMGQGAQTDVLDRDDPMTDLPAPVVTTTALPPSSDSIRFHALLGSINFSRGSESVQRSQL